MNNRLLRLVTGALVIALITGGCMLQPNVEKTGSLSFSFGSDVDTSAVIGTNDVQFVLLYLLRSGSYYNFDTGEFERDPIALPIDVSPDSVDTTDDDVTFENSVSGTSVTIEGLPPSTNYQVYVAAGKAVSLNNSLSPYPDITNDDRFLQVHSYASQDNITVSVGSVTPVENEDFVTLESGLDYIFNQRVRGAVAANDTVYVATYDGTNTNVYDVADIVAANLANQTPTAEFSVGAEVTSLGSGLVPFYSPTEDAIFVNTDGDGIYVWQGSGSAVQFGGTGGVSIVESDGITIRDDADEVVGSAIVYKSEDALAFVFLEDTTDPANVKAASVELAEGSDDVQWIDPLSDDQFADLPFEATNLVVDYAIERDNFDYGVFVTAVGTFFVNQDTIDAIIKDDGEDETTGYYFEFDDEDMSFTAYQDGQVLTGTIVDLILDPTEYIAGLRTIDVGEDNRIRSIALLGDNIILGTSQGLYYVPITDNAIQEDPVAQAIGSRLAKGVNQLESNGTSQAVAVYSDGTMDLLNLEGGTPDLDKRWPFYGGLPFYVEYDQDRRVYNADVGGIGLGFAGTTLYAGGPYGLIGYPEAE